MDPFFTQNVKSLRRSRERHNGRDTTRNVTQINNNKINSTLATLRYVTLDVGVHKSSDSKLLTLGHIDVLLGHIESSGVFQGRTGEDQLGVEERLVKDYSQ